MQRMTLLMEAALKQTVGYQQDSLEKQHAVLDKSLAFLKAQLHRTKETLDFTCSSMLMLGLLQPVGSGVMQLATGSQ